MLRGNTSSAVAVNDQAVARVCSELSHYAPKMHELAACLRGVQLHTDGQCADVDSFRGPLRALLAELDRLSAEHKYQGTDIIPRLPNAVENPQQVTPLLPTARPSTPPPRTACRKDIIPPSPEKRQKRKDSHGWH